MSMIDDRFDELRKSERSRLARRRILTLCGFYAAVIVAALYLFARVL
jgi:hypothetical protein